MRFKILDQCFDYNFRRFCHDLGEKNGDSLNSDFDLYFCRRICNSAEAQDRDLFFKKLQCVNTKLAPVAFVLRFPK
jgi:hypothetical protein